jgi:hypothetical protein
MQFAGGRVRLADVSAVPDIFQFLAVAVDEGHKSAERLTTSHRRVPIMCTHVPQGSCTTPVHSSPAARTPSFLH